MALLHQLLTENELKEVKKNKYIYAYDEVKELTIEELSILALILIKTKYNGMMPACVLSAECIVILVERAIEKDISIF